MDAEALMSSTAMSAPKAIADLALLVVIPVYNDWDAVSLLLVGLDRALAVAGLTGDVILVDDGSTSAMPSQLGDDTYVAIRRIDVLGLRRNMGHQRAIAIALAFAHERSQFDVVVVMDGDGEDAPDDVPRLLARLRENDGRQIIFAARNRRSEGLA